MPKATLYWFDLSVWASVARLGFIEKGYHAEDYESRTVNLCKRLPFPILLIQILRIRIPESRPATSPQ